jgi:hypothetical protein
MCFDRIAEQRAPGDDAVTKGERGLAEDICHSDRFYHFSIGVECWKKVSMVSDFGHALLEKRGSGVVECSLRKGLDAGEADEFGQVAVVFDYDAKIASLFRCGVFLWVVHNVLGQYESKIEWMKLRMAISLSATLF